MNLAKFLRTPFLQNTSGPLLLKLVINWEVHSSLLCSFAKFSFNNCSYCDGCTFHKDLTKKCVFRKYSSYISSYQGFKELNM